MKILRARVIEGSLSIPEALRSQTPGMTEFVFFGPSARTSTTLSVFLLPFTISSAMQMSRPPSS